MSVERVPLEMQQALLAHCAPMVAAIASLRGVTPAGIRGKRRMAYLVRARHEVWSQLWLNGMTYLGIAHAFGVDHTTILHAVRKTLGEERWQRERQSRRGAA